MDRHRARAGSRRRHVAEGADRPGHRESGEAADEDHRYAGPCPAAEAEAVEPDEDQQCAGWVAGDVSGPRIGLEVQDAGAEGAEHGADVGHAGNLVQVLVTRGEAVGDAALPTVDQGQREGPSDGEGIGEEQRGAPGDHRDGDEDGERSADADVRKPFGEQGRGAGEDVGHEQADRRGNADEHQCRAAHDKIKAQTDALGHQHTVAVIGRRNAVRKNSVRLGNPSAFGNHTKGSAHSAADLASGGWIPSMWCCRAWTRHWRYRPC